MLVRSARPLAEVHDLVMLDLDGVVYVGSRAVPGAAEAVARLGEAGTAVAYVTNNASRTPASVAAHLQEVGVAATPDEVVTAAQAAAAVLAQRHGPGARVFLAGGEGLELALAEAGLVAVADPTEPVDAVVTGFGPELPWLRVVHAAVLIGKGVPWVAANGDLSFPMEIGVGPGHGALVRLLADFTGATPTVAGKPERPLLQQTIDRVGAASPLMVGDRLDTDIAGARALGIPSLLVLTGVTGLAELAAAPPELRPTHLGRDLGALFAGSTAGGPDGRGSDTDVWKAEVRDGRVAVTGSGSTEGWWHAVVEAAWEHLDRTGRVADTAALEPPAWPGRDSVEP